jgi:hypothetical protein
VNAFILVGLLLGVVSGIEGVYRLKTHKSFFLPRLRWVALACVVILIGGIVIVVAFRVFASQQLSTDLIGSLLKSLQFQSPSPPPPRAEPPLQAFFQGAAGYAGGVVTSALGGFFGMVIYDRWRDRQKPRSPAST